MSTDLHRIHNIRDISDLITYLEIDSSQFHNCNPREFLTPIWSSVKEIWCSDNLTSYTDHGIEHSKRIITYFLQLKDLYHWSDYEKMLFAAAALIHDIGMQYKYWATVEGVSLGLPQPSLSNDNVRKNHSEIGYTLVKIQLNPLNCLKFPPALCDPNRHGHVNALNRAAHVAFAHSGDKYLNILREDEATWQSRHIEGHLYRPRLLAGTLRLYDELDGNYTRIPQPNRIYSWELDDTAKSHWLSCLFVEHTELTIDDPVVRIKLRWQVPDDADDNLRRKILDLLKYMREAKIRNEIEVIRNFYDCCNELKHKKEFVVDTIDTEPAKFILSLDKSLVAAIDKAISLKDSVIGSSTPKGVLAESIRKQQISTVSASIEGTQIRHYDSLDEELEDWFNINMESGHYELINKEHTDTYLKCRSLVSNQDLLRRIAAEIYKLHTDNNHQIDSVLAIGTSAIPLAVNVAFRLKCSVSFTFSKEKLGPKDSPNYFPAEVMPSVRECNNLLILDDVISGGTVVTNVLNTIQENFHKLPDNIYHHAIFRLGEREHDKEKRIKKFYYLKHIRKVEYATTAEECSSCKNNIQLIYEKSMY